MCILENITKRSYCGAPVQQEEMRKFKDSKKKSILLFTSQKTKK